VRDEPALRPPRKFLGANWKLYRKMTQFLPDGCLPEWSLQNRPCPYGVRTGLPLAHFTWPGEGATLFHYVAAFYSLNPFMVAAGALLLLLWFRGTRELLLLTFVGGVTLPTMICMKNLFAEKRPDGSCLLSCGMPSGHAMLSIGLMAWLGLEVGLPGGTFPPAIPGAVPWRSVIALTLLGLFFLPVGWSRVVFHDHDWPQVLAGSAVGAVQGVAWYLALRLPCASHGLEALASSKALRFARAVDNYAPGRRGGARDAPAAGGLAPGYGAAAAAGPPC